jgi:hypothetical protein
MQSLFSRILQAFGFFSNQNQKHPNPKPPNARAPSRGADNAPKPASAKPHAALENVFHMVLRRDNPLLPPTPKNLLIVATAYAQTDPDGTVKYGKTLSTRAQPEDILDVTLAIEWHFFFREGKCSREQVIAWLRECGQTMGQDLLLESRFAEQKVTDEILYPALTRITLQLILGCFASTTFPDRVRSSLLKRLKDESGDQQLYNEMVKGRRLVRAWQRGEIDREFMELVRMASVFVPVIPQTQADNPPFSFSPDLPE